MVEAVAPIPGKVPRKKPTSVPRTIDMRAATQSAASGSRRLSLSRTGSVPQLVLDVLQHLGDAEHADDHRQEADAFEQIRHAEGEAGDPALGVDADGADHQAEHARDHALDHGFAEQRADRRQRQDHQRGIFRRAEAQRHFRQRRRDQHQRDDAGGAGNEGRDRRHAERLARAPLPRHLVAVEAGHHRGRLARQVEQDRRGRAAVLRAVIDAGEHDEGGGRDSCRASPGSGWRRR